jgi:hypothetical protein
MKKQAGVAAERTFGDESDDVGGEIACDHEGDVIDDEPHGDISLQCRLPGGPTNGEMHPAELSISTLGFCVSERGATALSARHVFFTIFLTPI